MRPLLYSLIIGPLTLLFNTVSAQITVTELTPSVSQTVGFNGSKSDPVSVGAWGASGELFVRERRPNDAAERGKNHL